MKAFKALLFDLDNTLMDRDRTFRSFSTAFTDDFLGHLNEKRRRNIIEDMIERDADGYRDKDGFFTELSEVLPWEQAMSAAEIRSYYDKTYMSHGTAMEDSEAVLAYCRERGYRMGLVTNGKPGVQRAKIALLGLEPYFDEIVISGETDTAKPDPAIYGMALQRLGVLPEEALFIGDHPVNDIWGAGRAGIRGIWLRRRHEWDKGLDVGPWREIGRLDELYSHL